MEDISALHQDLVNQINNLQAEKTKSLNEQIQNFQSQQNQKDAMIQQAKMKKINTTSAYFMKLMNNVSGLN